MLHGGAGRDNFKNTGRRKARIEAGVAGRIASIIADQCQDAPRGGFHDHDGDIARSSLVEALVKIVLQGFVNAGLDRQFLVAPADVESFGHQIRHWPVGQQVLNVGFGKQRTARGAHGGLRRPRLTGRGRGHGRFVDDQPENHQDHGRQYPTAYQQAMPVGPPSSPAFELRLVVAPTGAPSVAGWLFVREIKLHRLLTSIYRRSTYSLRAGAL